MVQSIKAWFTRPPQAALLTALLARQQIALIEAQANVAFHQQAIRTITRQLQELSHDQATNAS